MWAIYVTKMEFHYANLKLTIVKENNLLKLVYLQIAIYGKNFCASAKDAFFLIMRNVVR
jgi:hypothetical protein